MELREETGGTECERSKNGRGFADHLLSTKKRPPFPYKQPDAETFAKWKERVPGTIDVKYTYFMRDRYSGLIKIGMSNNPENRRAALSASGEHDMEILLTLRDGCLEGCYHQHFANLRVHGEWFEPHPDILAEIERLSATP